jgi:hypothetical protein
MTSLSLSITRDPRALVSRLRRRARTAWTWLSHRLHRVRREHVLWLVLGAVFLLYLLALVLEPSAAGKGGR